MKLHLGCGGNLFKGWVNVDKYCGCDLRVDVVKLPGVRQDSVTEIYTCHMVEHLSPNQFRRGLVRWYKVLKKGGIIVIRCPDAGVKMKNWLKATDKERLSEKKYKHSILGLQTSPGQYNRNLMTVGMLKLYVEEAGFKVLESRLVSVRHPNLYNSMRAGGRDAGRVDKRYRIEDAWCKAVKE